MEAFVRMPVQELSVELQRQGCPTSSGGAFLTQSTNLSLLIFLRLSSFQSSLIGKCLLEVKARFTE